MRPSVPLIRSATFSLNYESDGDKSHPVCVERRSISLDSFLKDRQRLSEKKSSIFPISRRGVKEEIDLRRHRERASTLKDLKTKQPKRRHIQKENVVSLCPTVHVQRYRRAFARRWATVDTSTSSSEEENIDVDVIAAKPDDREEVKEDKIEAIPTGADFSNVFRERSSTWAGEYIQSYIYPPLRSTRSDNQGVLLFYMDKPQNPRSAGDYGRSELHSCICTPSQPASRTCSTLNDEEDEENVMIYLKRFMIWVTFAIKLILFTSLWALMMYWFLMSGGYVNVNPPPIILQDEWNTYIEKMQLFKFLPINNTYDTVEFEIQLQGPFADSNVFFNCQFERLYYHKDKYNSTDVRRDDADDVEVDHRIYEDSYSAVTSTTTRRTMSFTHSTLVWGWTWIVKVHWFIFSFTRTYYTLSMIPTTRTNTMTWWTFTTITARLTRYNLSRHPMTTFTIQEPYNFVPWGNIRVYSYSFRNFRAVSGRLHGHRHYGNMTADSNVTVTYGFRYMLNMTNMGDFLNNSALDTVAFAIQITKGMGRTSTTTTPAPLVVIKPADGIKYGFIIVGLLLALLFLQTNRVLALFVIAAVCISILSYLQLKPEPEVIAVWLNLDYVFELVFVMMVVATTVDTGFYDLVAFKIYDLTNGAIFGITSILCVCTFVLAVIMDCVVAIIFVTPLAIRTMEHGKMNPMPVLMSMILYCNMAAVLDADYNYVNHNIIKGRDRWQATDTAFEDTKIHQKTMPGVVVAAAATTLYILFVFKKLKPYAYNSPEVTMLMHRQTLLRMAASSVNRNSKSWEAIRNQLVEWHHEVDQERLRRLADDEPAPINKRFNKISDMTLLLKIGLVLGIFCALFLLRRYRLLGLGTVSISMLVAVCTGYLLLLLDPHDLNSLLRRCQWTTIMAILCIFFIERSFETMRLNKRLFQFLLGLVPDDKTSAPFYVVRYLQWVSFLFSAIFNNFGAVTTMRLVARRFGDIYPERVTDYVYAISFGCNVGGAATALGTGVAIACLASASQQGYRVSGCKYMIFMLPITLINMLCVYFIWVIVMD